MTPATLKDILMAMLSHELDELILKDGTREDDPHTRESEINVHQRRIAENIRKLQERGTLAALARELGDA